MKTKPILEITVPIAELVDFSNPELAEAVPSSALVKVKVRYEDQLSYMEDGTARVD